MNWDDYRVVLALGRKSNMTAAADVLGVNQTTVSRRLKTLQDELGIEVFRKLKSGLCLTEEGQKVYQLAEAIEQKIMSVESDINPQDQNLSGELHVSFSEIIGERWSWMFREFANRYPHIDLVLSLNNTKVSVMQRESDVVIRCTNSPPENLVGRKLATVEYALYGNKKLIKEVGDDHDFNNYPWMRWAEYCDAKLTEKWMRQYAPKARTVFSVDSMALMIEGIGDGSGIGFLPCIYGDSDPRLQKMRPVEPGFSMDLWVLTHPDRRFVRRVQVFMQEVYEAFTSREALFKGEKS
ncbi:MAG: LysR family transcriptional regulator [Acidiferrobacterales bacterium]|nr:LysR family transcriptional regulator [Acidiferrobacterales bacterium]